MLIRNLALGLLLAGCSWSRPAPPEYPEIRQPSGLTTRDLVVPSSGPEVAAGDTVGIHFQLRLLDRSLVESSEETGQPLRFQVGAGVVPRGLDEGVIGMRLFGRRRLTLPPTLAFGAEGRPPLIPGDATVVFDVELMELEPGL
jgi:FKBP-type peptidyl-prolyl cis-trans isomerase